MYEMREPQADINTKRFAHHPTQRKYMRLKKVLWKMNNEIFERNKVRGNCLINTVKTK